MKKCLPLFFLMGTLAAFRPALGQYYNQQSNFLNANKVWTFGTHCGLDFNSGSPVGITSENNSWEGAASVSDPVTGSLLFYSDGVTCWNRDHLPMPNGTGLLGNVGNSTTDGVCIVPFIDDPDKFYLFSMWGPTSGDGNPAGSLFYSVVDMSLEGGLGNVVNSQKNIALDSDTLLSEGMTAIPGNNCDIWLLVHSYIEPVFKAYHITAAGVDPIPVISQTGAQLHKSFPFNGGTIGTYFAGGMTVSPGRDMVAISSYLPVCLLGGVTVDSLVGVLLCQFDPTTGEVSNGIEVGESVFSYNTAFSPDNSKLYLLPFDFFASRYELVQYDVSTFDATAINNSESVLDSMLITQQQGGYLRLYGDTLYVNTYDTSGTTTYLSTINQPNLTGTAADFQIGSIAMHPMSGNAMYVLPKEVVYPMDPVTNTLAWDTTICMGWDRGIELEPLVTGAGYTYAWNDGSTNPVLTISDSGTYWVVYNDGCHFRTDTFKVAGEDLDPVITIEVLQLSTIETYATYQWMLDGAIIPGATGHTYDVLENGEYQVIVTDGGPCIDTSDVYLVNNLDIADHPLKARISVYPNPTLDKISIHAPVPVNIVLKDVTGKQLLQQNDVRSLSLSRWSDGIYFLHIRDTAGRTIKVEKVIKRK